MGEWQVNREKTFASSSITCPRAFNDQRKHPIPPKWNARTTKIYISVFAQNKCSKVFKERVFYICVFELAT